MFANPENIIKQVPIKDNFLIADFGCGSGGFSIPLARIARKGKIFAIDIQKEALSALELRKEFERAGNIKPILSDLEIAKGSKLGDSYIDLVVIANVLFLANDKLAIIQEARRIINNLGRILIVDWSENKIAQDQEIIPKQEIMRLAGACGLELEKEIDAGQNHYGLLFHKK